MPKNVLRIGVLALCALEASAVVVVLIGAFSVRTDLAGEGMAHAYALAILCVWLLFAAPAAALAWFGRWLWIALALALLPAVLVGMVMV